MKPQEILSVTDISETDWSNDMICMSANTDMSLACSNDADKEIKLIYEDEPEQTVYICLCKRCASDYTKKWDEEKIYGDGDFTLE